MLQYFTVDRTVEFILSCERAGINTWQLDHDEAGKAVAVVRELRARGSKMQFICLHSAGGGSAPLKKVVEDLGVIGFSHHGSVTDSSFRAKKPEVVHDYVKRVKDMGLIAGVSAHCPDHIKRISDEGWENDFFMTCFYHVTYPGKDQKADMKKVVVGEPFFDTDPVEMTKVVRSVPKPCLGFKILAAGRGLPQRRDGQAVGRKGVQVRLREHQAHRRRNRRHVPRVLRRTERQRRLRPQVRRRGVGLPLLFDDFELAAGIAVVAAGDLVNWLAHDRANHLQVDVAHASAFHRPC